MFILLTAPPGSRAGRAGQSPGDDKTDEGFPMVSTGAKQGGGFNQDG